MNFENSLIHLYFSLNQIAEHLLGLGLKFKFYYISTNSALIVS